MGEVTGIAWTDHTFNAWIGCQKVSEACKNCYAEALDERWGGGHWGPGSSRKITSENYWKQPARWDRAAKAAGVRRRVFCSSLADVFEDHPEVVQRRADLFKLIVATPNLDWLLLTKRPENIARMAPWMLGISKERCHEGDALEYEYDRIASGRRCLNRPTPPWSNVWLGTTVECQDYTDRIDHLVEVPAVVHFLSVEPMLGPLDIAPWIDPCAVPCGDDGTPVIDWVIIGCESGPGARPQVISDVRELVAQCVAHQVPVFLKQMTPDTKIVTLGRDSKAKRGGRLIELPYLDGEQYAEFPSPRAP